MMYRFPGSRSPTEWMPLTKFSLFPILSIVRRLIRVMIRMLTAT